MIELGRKFPSPEMLERIAAALEIDSPELFSTRLYPSKTSTPAQKLHDLIVSDIEKIISYRIREADLENQTVETKQGYGSPKNKETE
jgi:transcriptional regulator with XRE-family HTH domain